MHAVGRFRQVAQSFGWAGRRLFDNFGNHLEDRQKWDAITVAANHTTIGFGNAMQEFLRGKFSMDAWSRHKEFIRAVIKPELMSPQHHRVAL